jgi:hypothetical protein
VVVWAGLNACQFATLGTFLFAVLFLFCLAANRFVFSNDEGIYVDGARRMLTGQVPYRDFFTLVAPGSYWLEMMALKIFGMSLTASRLITILDLSILSGCICWLVGYRVTPLAGAWAGTVFMLLQAADPVIALPSHYWDSAALATLALTLVASGARRPYIFLAGVFLAYATWTTPTTGFLIGVLGFLLWKKNRVRFWPFLHGALAISLCCVCLLARQGALGAMYNQASWTLSNYSGTDRMLYGSHTGGYAALFEGLHSFAWMGQFLMALALIVSAVLPLLATGLFWKHRRTLSMQLLFMGGVTLLAATYPAMDVAHLTYATPLFYALCAIFIARLPWKQIRMGAFAATSILAGTAAVYGIIDYANRQSLVTAAGTVRAGSSDAALIRRLTQEIPRGSKAFIFPNLPIAYFLTLSENPTRYSSLQPGMMSIADETAALEELAQNPPQRVIYYDLPEWQILRLWPGSDPARLRLTQIESYLASHYRATSSIPFSGGDLRVLEPKPYTAANNNPIPMPTENR